MSLFDLVFEYSDQEPRNTLMTFETFKMIIIFLNKSKIGIKTDNGCLALTFLSVF